MDGNDVMGNKDFKCCFCGKSIESNTIDVTSIVAIVNWDKESDKQHEQQFFCHLNCFKEKLVKDIPVYLEDLIEE